MFARLARLVTRRPLWILTCWIALASVAAAYAMTGLGTGPGLFERLETGEPGVPGSQSEQVSAILDAAAGGPTTTLLVTGVDLADDAVVAAVGEHLADADLAAAPEVAEVLSPFVHPAGPLAPEVAGLVGTDQDSFVVRATLIVVFAGFASGELLPIKEVGFALAVAVALDATIVRMLLVPATMTVLGDANWWAPRWLKPIARRLAVQH